MYSRSSLAEETFTRLNTSIAGPYPGPYHRVVVTGMGAISPVGLDVPSLWEAVAAGRSGVDYITSFDTAGFDTRIAAEVKGFDATAYVSRKQAQRMDRFTQFAAAASLQAAAAARFTVRPADALATS